MCRASSSLSGVAIVSCDGEEKSSTRVCERKGKSHFLIQQTHSGDVFMQQINFLVSHKSLHCGTSRKYSAGRADNTSIQMKQVC